MVRQGEDTSGGHYTLYLEYLGGLIPLLKGKRASKLRPDFVIFDPKIRAKNMRNDDTSAASQNDYDISSSSSLSDSDVETDGCSGSPRLPRKRRQKTNFRAGKIERSTTYRTLNDLFFNDNLPENSKLVEVTSNIWGTKFRITGTASHLPEDMGNVLYKTSLLHLQPRQMTVTITEIPRDESLLSQDRNFSPAGVGEEEADCSSLMDGLLSGVHNERYAQNNIPASVENNHDLANQEADIISVDILTNQCEFSNHVDETAERNSMNSTNNSVGCYSDRQNKPVCMKTKLSPASETHPQNSHAFNTVNTTVIRDSYIREDVRPKVPISQPSYRANQNVSNESGVLSLTMNANENANGATLTYDSYVTNSNVKSVSSQPVSRSESLTSHHTSRSGSIAEQPVPQLNSPVIGNYFFVNGDADSSKCDINVDSHENVHKPALSLVDKLFPADADILSDIPRWADPACGSLKFADDDDPSALNSSVYESNTICDSSQIVTPTSDTQKRLYLEGSQDLDTKTTEQCEPIKSFGLSTQYSITHDKTVNRKSGIGTEDEDDNIGYDKNHLVSTCKYSSDDSISAHKCNDIDSLKAITHRSNVESRIEKMILTQSASLPATPVRSLHKLDSPTRKLREDVLVGKCRHHSPLFKRKSKYAQLESSDDEISSSTEDVHLAYNFKNLESFQKAQFKQKLKRVRGKGDDKKGAARLVHQFAMHNKAPLWNENSQVYQLDFGGRVTQESAKNFQIEFKGKQVMQFGRIDSNAYTLDFQYPFTAIQAFAVALANVTQRLK